MPTTPDITVTLSFAGLTPDEALKLTTDVALLRANQTLGALAAVVAAKSPVALAHDPQWAGKELKAEKYEAPPPEKKPAKETKEPAVEKPHKVETKAKPAPAEEDDKAAEPPKPSKNGMAAVLPDSVVKAKTVRDVIAYLRDTENIKEQKALAARCEELRATVGILKPVKNMAQRVEFVLTAMGES